MANPSIRGHQAQIRFFKDGGDVQVVNLKNFDINQDSTFIKSMYVGKRTPVGDQSVEGWSGSGELEVSDATVDEMIDALVNDNLNGIGVSDYQFVVTQNYSNGQSKSHVYFDCQWKMGQRFAGMNEKITQKLEYQAMERRAL